MKLPESTKKSTKWDVKVFLDYCGHQNIKCDFESITEDALADILKKFYGNIRKKDGQLYTPSALVGIRAAINRKLTSPPLERNINILEGSRFLAANRIF